MSETYTIEEVAKHTSPEDLWMVLHNKVYNVTNYLQDHPGGGDVLKEVAGTNATSSFEDIGHSEEARDQLKEFIVGNLSEEDHEEVVEAYQPTFQKVEQASYVLTNKKETTILESLKRPLALVVLGVAATYTVGRYAWNARDLPVSLSKSFEKGTGSSHGFWYGFIMASAFNATIAAGLGVWFSTKFDVQQEFTSYPSHRPGQHLALKKRTAVLEEPPLHPREWRKFKLIRKDKLSPNVVRLILALPTQHSVLGLPIGQHISIRADIDGKSVQRSYTPTSNDTDLGRLELVIKVYDKGLMTNYLANCTTGDEIEIRGPKGTMKYSSSLAKHIGMIAGGTGITPMYQLIRAICSDPNDKTTVSLLYANNTPEDILLHDELNSFAKLCPEKFDVTYVLSHPPPEWTGAKGFITQDLISEKLPGPEDDSKIMLCGPPPMINAMKKSLSALAYQEPGALTKMTDQVFMF